MYKTILKHQQVCSQYLYYLTIRLHNNLHQWLKSGTKLFTIKHVHIEINKNVIVTRKIFFFFFQQISRSWYQNNVSGAYLYQTL